MSDEKNTEQTAKLDELFAPESTDAASGSVSTTTLPEAEPAWLSHRGPARPVRTTPRVRWAGIIWGLVFAATGWYAAWTLLVQDRRAAFSNWILSLDGGGWAIAGAFALGGLLLVIGLTEGLRAATRGRGA